MKVPVQTPKSFLEFVEIVEGEQQNCAPSGQLWFRGSGRASYGLVPTIYRHPTARTVPALEELEQKLMVRFRQRSIPFVSESPKDEWDMLFFMQHYGVPTRLLDWTENSLIALYFAVMSAPFKTVRGTPRYGEDAAVWILNPDVWNSSALAHQSYDRGILTPVDEALGGYKPGTKFKDMNLHPVALYGAHNSPRIVAQRGAFTIFGQSSRAMEKVFESESFSKKSLLKIVISKDALPGIRQSVLNQGITESVVFPDLENLAKEIRRCFAFEH